MTVGVNIHKTYFSKWPVYFSFEKKALKNGPPWVILKKIHHVCLLKSCKFETEREPSLSWEDLAEKNESFELRIYQKISQSAPTGKVELRQAETCTKDFCQSSMSSHETFSDFSGAAISPIPGPEPARAHPKLSKEFYIELAAFSDSVYDRGRPKSFNTKWFLEFGNALLKKLNSRRLS